MIALREYRKRASLVLKMLDFSGLVNVKSQLLAVAVILALCGIANADTYTDNRGNVYTHQGNSQSGNLYRNGQNVGYYEHQPTSRETMESIDRRLAESSDRLYSSY